MARECQLLDRVPLLINLEALQGTSDVDDRLDLIEKTFDGRVLATARPVARRWVAPPTVIVLPPLSGNERAVLRSRALPEASQGDAKLLSTIYPLARALIDAVGRVAIEDARGAPLEAKHVSVGIRTVLDRLAGLATRVTVTQKREDLVLPEDQTLAVVELLARIRATPRLRGLGLCREAQQGSRRHRAVPVRVIADTAFRPTIAQAFQASSRVRGCKRR